MLLQADETGDPFAEQRPYRVGREVGVPGAVAPPQQPADALHQPGHLEFLVRG